jgi:hypothetical protein
VLGNYNAISKSQMKFKQEMTDILMAVKQMQNIIRNQLNIMKKEHFMSILEREIKLLNQKVPIIVNFRFNTFTIVSIGSSR